MRYTLRFFSLLIFTITLFTQNVNAQKNCPTWEWALEVAPTDISLIKMRGDSIGDMYVLGSFKNTVTFGSTQLIANGPSYFIAKIDTLGQWQWAKQFEIPSSVLSFHVHEPVDINIAKTGHVSVVGSFEDSVKFDSLILVSSDTNYVSMFAARLNPATMQWDWAVKTDGTYGVLGSSIFADSYGNTYITCRANSLSPANDTVWFGNTQIELDTSINIVAKISSDGIWKWAKVIGPVINSTFSDSHVNVTKSRNPVIATAVKGKFKFNGQTINFGLNKSNILIMAYDTAGQQLWYNNTLSYDTKIASSLAIGSDKYSSIYVHCLIDGVKQFGQDTISSNYYTSVIAKLNASGQWVWAKKIKTSGMGSAFNFNYLEMATRPSGDSYISGAFQGQIVFGNDSLESNSPTNIYVAKMDSSGTWQWAGMAHQEPAQFGSQPFVKGVSATPSDRMFTMGHYFATLNFGFHPVVTAGRFLAKLRPDSTISLNMPKDTTLHCGESMVLKPRTSSVAQMYYTWSPSTGLSSTTERNPTANPTVTTTYTVTARTSNGCVASANYTIYRDTTLRGGSRIGFSTSTGGNTVCDNTTLLIDATGAFASYKWNTGDTAPIIHAKRPGTYVLTAVDYNGCYSKDSIEIRGPVKITAPTFLLCQNDSVKLSINPFGLDSIKWSTGSTSSYIHAKQTGTYWVTIKKGNCIFTDTVEVSPFSGPGLAQFTYTNNGLTATFKPVSIGIAKGFWNFGDGNVMNGITATHTYASYGTYQVCYQTTDVCGFTDYKCDSITIAPISLPELKKPTEFSIYPNPGNGLLNIECTDYGSHQLKLIDLSGKVLLEKKLNNNTHWEINLSHLPQGCYFIRIDNQTKTFMKN